MAIRPTALYGLLGLFALASPAAAGPLSQVEAVRLFLGLQAQSPVTVEGIESGNEGVTVKGLSAPLGQDPDAPRLHIEVLQISGIVPGETSASFGSILGTGISVAGPTGLSARSLMMTDVAAKDLGVKPLSIASVDNLLLGDLVIADQARVESYSVSMVGVLSGTFSGTVKIQGIQTVATPAAQAGLGDRFDVALQYRGDGPGRTFETSYTASQSLIGVIEGEARWSDVTFRAGSTSPLAQFDLLATLQDAKLVTGSMALRPGPNGRMLLRALPPSKREELALVGRKLVERDGSVPAEASATFGQTLTAFLNRPERLLLSATPREPVAMNSLGGMPTVQAVIERLGLRLSEGERP